MRSEAYNDKAASRVAVSVIDDLRHKVHELARLHSTWNQTRQIPDSVRPVVARAWSRQAGIAVAGCTPPPQPADAIRERRERAGTLGEVVERIGAQLLDFAQDASNELVVCDADGIVLWVNGPREVLRRTEQLGFVEGVCWTEEAVGNNALGTALTERTPVQIFGPEHSNVNQHLWVCTGAPIIDPVTDTVLGAMTLSGPLKSAHPHTLSLVQLAVEGALGDLRRAHRARLATLATSVGSISGDRYVVVDEHGWVAERRGIDAGPRLWSPRGWHEGRIWLPTHGSYECQPVPGGWALTQSTGDGVRLELRETPRPLARVLGPGEVHDIPLTRRQFAMLDALAANPEGLTGAALTDAIYDAPVSATTLRAEVSRLRRHLGSLLESRPYRLTVPCHRG